MPRGRHRHSPPLHRLLPPSAIAGVSLVCALGPWVFTDAPVLRVSAAFAAATAAVGAAVMRRWDVEAGKRVADLTRARAGDEWRHEEQVAELEADLEESRELRQKLEQKLRAKRSELAGLRNEHAALLRRYATAETERATALEGRRRLAIETSSAPAKALPAGGEGAAEPAASDESTASDEVSGGTDSAPAAADEKAAETKSSASSASGVFTPDGSSLFLRANSALDRIVQNGSAKTATAEKAQFTGDGGPKGEPRKNDSAKSDSGKGGPGKGGPGKGGSGKAAPGNGGSPDGGSRQAGSAAAEAAPAADAAEEDDHPETHPETQPETQPEPAEGHARVATEPEAAESDAAESAAAEPADAAAAPAASAGDPTLPAQPAGHFTVPTAVAVVPAATPRRSPAGEGGFDFFGTQKDGEGIEDVQNEDLADVIGREALALHKAESEAQFKPADEDARGIGQVIDLTAHDETEHIDVEGLRTAVS
ncbi:coiled-coil domain-containing protein [Streptomyces acidicola]|uniref:hypothetical protein n=1 Tax=Streptomyces acidicola TaxID=2596892 RepID=UPI003821E458